VSQEKVIGQETIEQTLFSAVIGNGGSVRRRQELVTTFASYDVFKDVYYVLYSVVKEFPNIEITKDFMLLYLQSNKAIFSQSSSVDLNKFSLGDSDPFVEFGLNCVAIFEECIKKVVEDESFYRSLEMFKMQYVNVHSITILEESAIILSEGIKSGRKTLSGYSDMRSNLRDKFQKLDNIVEKKDRKGIIVYGNNDNEDEITDGVKLVTTFGIAPLDKAIGGIYEGDMVSAMAPSKGGKSRFATYVLHNAIVNHGVSSVMWSVENGNKGWEALIRARHFQWFYNERYADIAKHKMVNSDMIRKGEMPKELFEMEKASWADLRLNTSYGRIANIDEDFDLDNFLEVLDNAVNEIGAKFVCIDYLQLIGDSTKYGNKAAKNERIADAYKKCLQYLKKKKIGGFFPAQLKQSFVGSLSKLDDKDIINAELRDSAGESYEVIKTPDVNLALYGTVESMREGRMKLISVPSRNSSSFEPIDMYCDLGTCSFYPIVKEQ